MSKSSSRTSIKLHNWSEIVLTHISKYVEVNKIRKQN